LISWNGKLQPKKGGGSWSERYDEDKKKEEKKEANAIVKED
jgi:hypothetical protein